MASTFSTDLKLELNNVNILDVYPTNIGELQYDQQAADVQYLTASVTFNYRGYDFANVGASSTTVTTLTPGIQ